MKKEALSFFAHADLVLLSFMLFLFTFIGVLIWVLRKSQQGHYKNMSLMPFESTQKGASHE